MCVTHATVNAGLLACSLLEAIVTMTNSLQAKATASLKLHEGWRNFPYVDTVGKTTIGVGYNITDRGLPDEWIGKQLLADITWYYNQYTAYPWFANLSEDRQVVLIDMAFMGWQHVLEFHEMLTALAKSDFAAAADAMLDSVWAKQVGKRATDLADGMRSGVYNP